MSSWRSLIKHFTPDEQAYIISQVDPFHDTPYKLSGAPSVLQSRSLVLTLNQQRTITAADFGIVTPGSKFDCHFALIPMIKDESVYTGNLQGVGNFQGSNQPALESDIALLSPFCISAVEHTAGGSEITFALPNGSTGFIGNNSSGISTFVDGNGYEQSRYLRLLGHAFEVVDSSPQIYQQGTCTVYATPNCEHHGMSNVDWVDAVPAVRTAYAPVAHMAVPPSNIATTQNIGGTHSWDACEGAYVIARRSGGEPQFKKLDVIPKLFTGSMPTAGERDPLASYAFVSRSIQQTVAPAPPTQSNATWDYNVSGAYFTGLSTDYCTLRATYKSFWEILPSADDTTLVSVATPTLPSNPEVYRIIDLILADAPVGVRQTDNPSGEYWRSLMRSAAKIGRAIAPPITLMNPAAGAMIGSASEFLGQGAKLGEKKKKPKKGKVKAITKKN